VADLEIGLLSRAVMTGRVGDLVSAGVTPEHFIDPLLKTVFQACAEHNRTWRHPLTVEGVKRLYPEFRPEPEVNDLDYLIAEFAEDRSVKFAEKYVMDMADVVAIASDPSHPGYLENRKTLVDQVMQRSSEYAASIPSSAFTRYSEMGKRVSLVREQQEAGVLPGIKLGIDQVDEWTHAIRDTEVVAFCGYSGKGKTQNLVRATAAAYAQEENVVKVSLEMENSEVWEIYDAMAARLSRTALARRQLGDEDYGRWEQAAARVRDAKNDIVLMDDTKGAPTVEKLAALVERHRPGVLAVDYISLLAASVSMQKDYERVTLISRQLKQLARAYKVKVYVAAQNNRDAVEHGPTEENIAFSNAIFQDCNVMVGVHQDGKMEKIGKVEQRLIKNRAGAKGPAGKLHAMGYGLFYERWDRDTMEFEDWKKIHEWRAREEA
jgi:replicative DNA helicase